MMRNLCVLLAVSLLDAAHSSGDDAPVTGLWCVNDYVRNVSCQWLGSLVATGGNCLISGVMRIGIGRNLQRVNETCKLEHGENSPPGCTFSFKTKFNAYKVLNISLRCDGVQVAALVKYKVKDHVKLHPPGAPEVNDTLIWWREVRPRPENIHSVDFQVQIKARAEPWGKARNLSTSECWIRTSSEKFQGSHQVRVRGKPGKIPNSHWSDWSPAVPWAGPISTNSQGGTLDRMLIWRLALLLGIPLALTLVLVGVRIRLYNRTVPRKQMPNPSKYFHSLNSIHGSNLKRWLNPLSASESFFTTKQREHISPVQLCERQGAPSSSPSPAGALLHYKACCSPTGPDTSGTLDHYSSSSSSFYSNIGYFLSSSSGTSARTDPNPAYFTHQDPWQDGGPSVPPRHRESLKREPHSPDSGFSGEKGSEEEREDVREVDVGEWKDLPAGSTVTTSLPAGPPPHPAEEPLDGPPAEAPAAEDFSCAAWPSAASVARSSSVNVEPSRSRSGYLTVKDLQLTFRNKSI